MAKVKIKIGDRVRFKVATRSYHKEAVRIVTGVWDDGSGKIEVRYHGWSGFVLAPHEYKKVKVD